MIFPSHIEKKYNFILTFALATPFLRPRDPQVGKPWILTDNNIHCIDAVYKLTLSVKWDEDKIRLNLTNCSEIGGAIMGDWVVPPGFDPRTSRTPTPWPGTPSHCVLLQRFLAHLVNCICLFVWYLSYSKTRVGLSSAGQKTAGAFSSFGSVMTRKLGEVRDSNAFKSFEEKVSTAATNVKVRDYYTTCNLKGHSEITRWQVPSIFIKSEIFAFW